MTFKRTWLLLAALVWIAAGGFAQNREQLQQPPTLPIPAPDAVSTPRITNATAEGQISRGQRSGQAGEAQRAPAAPAPQLQQEMDEKEAKEEQKEHNEFQDFLELNSGQKLPLFGRDMFARGKTTLAPDERAPVTGEYMVAPGDEVILKGWGQVDIDYRAVVDRDGSIFVPKVGAINVAGIRYDELQPYLKQAIGRVFQNFDLAVTLGNLRPVQVFVVGFANKPGSYTLRPQSTIMSALFACEGPSPRGSLRNIQLKRNGSVAGRLDVYQFLISGDKSGDVLLRNGDVIFVPPIGPQAGVRGSVNLPAIYELKGEETLGQVLKLAGGMTPVAEGRSVTIERIADRSVRRIEDLPLDEAGLQAGVINGDVITVRTLSAKFENAVTLRGNVAVPGRYPWKPGLRVRDLLKDKESLLTREFWLKQNQLGRTSMLNEELNRQTHESEMAEVRRGVDISALRNDIRRTAPDVNWDYAVIQRLNRSDLSARLLSFNLGKALFGTSEEDNPLLEPDDVITVFSQEDIKVPDARRTKFVRLEGEFVAAGIHEIMPGETLRHLAERVGGLTSNAYLFGSEFTREATQIDQQKQLDKFVFDLEREIERLGSFGSQNITSAEDVASLREKLESQRKMVDKLKQVKASGRIVLGIPAWAGDSSALPDIPLEDGDRFYVPYKPGTVNVIGAVHNNNSYIYQQNASVQQYLRRAGGGTKYADMKHVFVVRADGSVVKATQGPSWFSGSMGFRVMPGDTVVVPEQLVKIGLLKGLKDWSQVIAQFALGAAAIQVFTRN